jgi:hypothetical protein
MSWVGPLRVRNMDTPLTHRRFFDLVLIRLSLHSFNRAGLGLRFQHAAAE